MEVTETEGTTFTRWKVCWEQKTSSVRGLKEEENADDEEVVKERGSETGIESIQIVCKEPVTEVVLHLIVKKIIDL